MIPLGVIGGGVGSAAPLPDPTLVASGYATGPSTLYGVPFGPVASSARTLCFGYVNYYGPNKTMGATTIAGVPATVVSGNWAIANVPSGVSGDIVMTEGTAVDRWFLWVIDAAVVVRSSGAERTAASSVTRALSGEENDIVLAIGRTKYKLDGTYTWSPALEATMNVIGSDGGYNTSSAGKMRRGSSPALQFASDPYLEWVQATTLILKGA